VIYWNILLHHLENEFTWNKCQNVQGASTLIYAAYLSVQTKNNSLYNEVKAALQTILPVMLNEKGFFDEHIEKYSLKLEQFIDSYLDSIDYENILYFGFSVKDSQWILASVIAEKIKEREAKAIIVIIEICTSEKSKALLKNFMQFDVAFWGEHETQLLKLIHFLLNSYDFSKFNIAKSHYRENGIIKESSIKKTLAFDLSEKEVYSDFSDFFYYRNLSEISAQVDYLCIESGRGCHWNRCRFCYLNRGYKYRQKSVKKLYQEIKYLISTHKISRFALVGNDIIGKDMNRFDSLLNELIKIKNEYNDFAIYSAEVISTDLSHSAIIKMKEAGFVNIQIGFESVNNSLLKKIDKKNTFASNLNAIKHCVSVGINVGGANVLYNLLEETEDDIYESIENLRFFRFIMGEEKGFILHPIPLKVNSTSRYHKDISEKKQEYTSKINLYHKAFTNLFDEETRWYFFEFSLNLKNPKWGYFTDMQYHYTKNNYEYKFIYEDDKIIYQEFINKELIEDIEFYKNELYIYILNYCYDKAISIHELNTLLSENNGDRYSIDILKEKIDTLFYQGFLYRTPCYNEIVSIVNINLF
jgi:radical SAM superfamily enzyme YgiQ (UPF0313 family)